PLSPPATGLVAAEGQFPSGEGRSNIALFAKTGQEENAPSPQNCQPSLHRGSLPKPSIAVPRASPIIRAMLKMLRMLYMLYVSENVTLQAVTFSRPKVLGS